MPRAYLGITVPGFPNMFLLYGPNTNGGAGSVIYTVEAATQHVIARDPRGRARQAPARSSCARRPPRTSTASCARHSPERSGTAAARNWYVDEHGIDPNQWPWVWSTYRRRTAKVDPAAYELA